MWQVAVSGLALGQKAAWWLHHSDGGSHVVASSSVLAWSDRQLSLVLAVPLTARLETRTKESMELACWLVIDQTGEAW